MLSQFVKRYQRLERDIDALTYVLMVFILILVVRAVVFVYECRYHELWTLLAPITPLLAALVVTRVANRQITNGNIIRAEDQHQEIVRVTHHLIAITKDLHARVEYVKGMFGESDRHRPMYVLFQIVATIENRYETLLEPDAYKFLPGNCVDNITRMSGNIFGLRMLADGMKQLTSANPSSVLLNIPNKNNQMQVAQLDKLMADLQELIDDLFKLRMSIHAEH